jgi:hypothetical protein
MVSFILDIASIICIFLLGAGLTFARIFLSTEEKDIEKFSLKKIIFILAIVTFILIILGIIVYLVQ